MIYERSWFSQIAGCLLIWLLMGSRCDRTRGKRHTRAKPKAEIVVLPSPSRFWPKLAQGCRKKKVYFCYQYFNKYKYYLHNFINFIWQGKKAIATKTYLNNQFFYVKIHPVFNCENNRAILPAVERRECASPAESLDSSSWQLRHFKYQINNDKNSAVWIQLRINFFNISIFQYFIILSAYKNGKLLAKLAKFRYTYVDCLLIEEDYQLKISLSGKIFIDSSKIKGTKSEINLWDAMTFCCFFSFCTFSSRG